MFYVMSWKFTNELAISTSSSTSSSNVKPARAIKNSCTTQLPKSNVNVNLALLMWECWRRIHTHVRRRRRRRMHV